MVDRRTFTTLLLGGIAAPKASFAQSTRANNVFYAGVGPELTLYSVDVDNAKFAHQIRPTPDNQHVIMVTRGNNAPSDNPVNPGSIKTFSFKNGVLANLAAIQPGDGMNFGPRHLDFHPTQPWAYVSVESQNKLHVYKRDAATGISREPLFVKETL